MFSKQILFLTFTIFHLFFPTISYTLTSCVMNLFLLKNYSHSAHSVIILPQIFPHLSPHSFPVFLFHLSKQRMVHRNHAQIFRIIQKSLSLKFFKWIREHISLHRFSVFQHFFIIRAGASIHLESSG